MITKQNMKTTNDYWGVCWGRGGGSFDFTGPTSPSVFEVVQNINWLFGSRNNPLTHQ